MVLALMLFVCGPPFQWAKLGAAKRPGLWEAGGSMASGQSSADSIGNPLRAGGHLGCLLAAVPSKGGPTQLGKLATALSTTPMGSKAGFD